MSFTEKFEAGLSELHKAQTERAWALVTGLLATLVAVFVSSYIFSGLRLTYTPDQLLAIAWAVGAMYGALSLVYFGSIAEPSGVADRVGYLGLWAGNLTFSGTVAAVPIAVILGMPLVIGGFFIIRRKGRGIALAYLAMPIVALAGSIIFVSIVAPAFGR
jgi:hypothetical protein